MDENELKKRTTQFGLRVMKLVGALPNDSVGRAIGSQLIRSGTPVGANCRTACRGRSKAEFIAKLGIVVEEADESGYWMELIIEGELLPLSKSYHYSTKQISSQRSWSPPGNQRKKDWLNPNENQNNKSNGD